MPKRKMKPVQMCRIFFQTERGFKGGVHVFGLKEALPLFLGQENLKAREVVPTRTCLNSSGIPRCCSILSQATLLNGTARRLSLVLKVQVPILISVS